MLVMVSASDPGLDPRPSPPVPSRIPAEARPALRSRLLPSGFPGPPLAAALAVALPAATLMVASPPYFETNDDVWMMLNVSGVTLPEPTEYVLWMNVIPARGLVALYRLAGGVPWYGLLHAAAVLAALTATAYAVLLRNASPRRLCLVAAGLFLLGFPGAVQWQFTRTAALAVTGGVFLAAAALRPLAVASTPKTVVRLGTAVGLLLLGYTIRTNSFWLVVVLSVPLTSWLAFTAERRRVWGAGLLLVVALFVAAAWAMHARAYGSPEWVRYRELNRLKSPFLDFQAVPFDETTRPIFEAAGWSETDYRMLMRWFYVDRETYSPEKLAMLVARASLSGPPRLARFRRGLGVVCRDLAISPFAWVAGVLLLGAALLEVRRPTALAALLISVLVAVGIMVLLESFAKLPARVSEPMLTMLAWLPLVLGGGPARGQPPPKVSRATAAVGLVLIAVAVLLGVGHPRSPIRAAIEGSRRAQRTNAELRAALHRLQPEPRQTVVVLGANFPYDAILPIEETHYLRDLRIVAVGASNQSPAQRRVLAARSLDDLPRALFERDDVLVALRPESEDDRLLERYIQEHYGVPVRVTGWFRDGPLRLWKVTKTGSATSVPRPFTK